eukprot:CAMPEP_0205819880 /NCGR_PEP_ID=MMETSP0206-20130828/2377_1 /ASSEMBLY_ACC=CAM_ASM_000279 /TAXON_ID=36767 /ORGANISM="Euplotes focardii, Strain TN1" /LENGTH=215 /DNA_ID=CAMNT_0053113951 /DNA_START=15 /DNA_END=662 /DNA_ORIENTATION=+
MVKKRTNNANQESTQKEDKIFEISNDLQNPLFSTPDQSKRVSRYDSNYCLEGRLSTPLDHSKRNSLDPNYSSPNNHSSFSSGEAMWKMRMKASDTGVIPYQNSSGKKSSISPVRLKNDLVNVENLKKQIKAKAMSMKSQTQESVGVRSERQISDPKRLLDEFMLPHATIMACSKKKKEEEVVTWRKKARALSARRRKVNKSEPKTEKKQYNFSNA